MLVTIGTGRVKVVGLENRDARRARGSLFHFLWSPVSHSTAMVVT